MIKAPTAAGLTVAPQPELSRDVVMNSAVNDYLYAAEARYDTTGSLEIDTATDAEISSRHGLDEHRALGAKIVGTNMARVCIPSLTSLERFTELI